MKPVSEVYVVLSGKSLVYVTLNLSDAEGLQYRLNEAGVDAAVGPAVLVTQERYSELRGNGVDWFATVRAKDEYISKLTKEVDQLKGEVAGRVSVISMLQDTSDERKSRIEAQESALRQSTRRVHELTELLEDSKSFAAYLNKEVQRLRVELEESEEKLARCRRCLHIQSTK